MNGKGWVYDNIFIERLYRSVKYEEVYLFKGLSGYFGDIHINLP
jgi:hypothetical protein